MTERIFNFMFRSDNKLYAWVLSAGICGTVLVRIIQILGLVALLRTRQNAVTLLLLTGWCVYILLVNGPVASPKYRLPMEPALAVMTGAGWVLLRRRLQNPAS
jgi:4-amino-4-deoxy-L-arabinose transferase-like glycosyltransferase